jgi:hypothetical protein
MLVATRLPSTLKMGPTEIHRVESLMKVEFHKLPKADRDARALLGALRCKEALSCVPFYANRAAKTPVDQGGEMAYWQSLWRGHVNMIHPSKTPSGDS